MDFNTILQGVILCTGVIGQLFVAHRNLQGFYWWMVCNLATIAASVQAGLYGVAALSVFYSVMCFYSIFKWRQLDKVTS